jgi:hypothetical protein
MPRRPRLEACILCDPDPCSCNSRRRKPTPPAVKPVLQSPQRTSAPFQTVNPLTAMKAAAGRVEGVAENHTLTEAALRVLYCEGLITLDELQKHMPVSRGMSWLLRRAKLWRTRREASGDH